MRPPGRNNVMGIISFGPSKSSVMQFALSTPSRKASISANLPARNWLKFANQRDRCQQGHWQNSIAFVRDSGLALPSNKCRFPKR
jgi:hypothetical protein